MFSFQYEELFHFIFGKMFRSLTNEIWEVETFVWDSTDPQHMILKSTEKLLMNGISAWSLNLYFVVLNINTSEALNYISSNFMFPSLVKFYKSLTQHRWVSSSQAPAKHL